ncbi:MAG: TolC family protein, partial [Planctomycetota bacterium]
MPVVRLLEAARLAHPTADAVAAARASAMAQVRQAEAWANPTVALSLSQTRPRVGGVERDRPYGGSLSQRLEWWGKRAARVDAARAQSNAAEAEGRVALLELEANVRLAVVAYAAAREAAAQADSEAKLTAEIAAMMVSRQAVGDADRASVARARLEATTTALRSASRHRDIATALTVLRTWCDPTLPDDLALADPWLTDLLELDPQHLRAAAERHPRLRALADATLAAEARVTAEHQARLPDVTIGVSGMREIDQDTYGFTLGFDMPLWNQNEGAIAGAEANRSLARATMRIEYQRLQRDLAEALGAVTTAQHEATVLAEQAVPAAEEALALRTAAFKAGDASLTDLFEAR